MAFCYNCGTPHDEDSRFCENCGVRLEYIDKGEGSSNADETASNETASGLSSRVAARVLTASCAYVATQIADVLSSDFIGSAVEIFCDFIKSGDSRSYLVRRGVLMTNISRLSERFSVAPERIEELLRAYIKGLQQLGVDYILLDVSNNGCGNSWVDHSLELTKLHIANFKGYSQPVYLFIIGGDDIIPMPTIDNLYYHARAAAGDNRYHDKDVETDLPYAYLLGETTQQMVYNGQLFKYKPQFCVGRLPFDKKSDVTVLVDYLKRSFLCHRGGGVTIRSTYAQTCKDWRNESSITSGLLNEKGLLPPYSSRYDERFAYNNLITSPGVVESNVHSVLNTEADLLFFNMHGSDNPVNPDFLSNSSGFSPKQLESLTHDNIFITEACYGAKFKGLDANFSMLLTALKNKTVIYFGSSRIALGGGGSTYDRVEDLIAADLYFKYLTDEFILGGHPVGYSVERARVKYVKAKRRLELKDMLTIAEFNTYGDPTICSQMEGAAKYSSDEDMKLSPLAEGRDDCGFTIETLYENTGNSLLSMIRSRVDASLKHIVDTINKEMYERHGLSPRSLSSVTKISYNDKSDTMEFVYSVKESCDRNAIYVVQVENGESKVLISK